MIVGVRVTGSLPGVLGYETTLTLKILDRELGTDLNLPDNE